MERAVTARGAALVIVVAIVIATVVCAFVMRLADPEDFPTFGEAIWWAAQTATTVGYGDVVPHSPSGRLVGVVLMILGVAFLTIVTAAVTAIFIESSRSRLRKIDPTLGADAEIVARLERIEKLLGGHSGNS
jgi:voltage-gated potassium channel